MARTIKEMREALTEMENRLGTANKAGLRNLMARMGTSSSETKKDDSPPKRKPGGQPGPRKRVLTPQEIVRKSRSKAKPNPDSDPTDPGALARIKAKREKARREGVNQRTAIRKGVDPETKADQAKVLEIFAKARAKQAERKARTELATHGNNLINQASRATSTEEKRAALDHFHNVYVPAYAKHYGEENMNDPHHREHLQGMYNTIRSVKVSGGDVDHDAWRATAAARDKATQVLRKKPKHRNLVHAMLRSAFKVGPTPAEKHARSASGRMVRDDVDANAYLDTVKRIIAERRQLNEWGSKGHNTSEVGGGPRNLRGRKKPRRPGDYNRKGRELYRRTQSQELPQGKV